MDVVPTEARFDAGHWPNVCPADGMEELAGDGRALENDSVLG